MLEHGAHKFIRIINKMMVMLLSAFAGGHVGYIFSFEDWVFVLAFLVIEVFKGCYCSFAQRHDGNYVDCGHNSHKNICNTPGQSQTAN